MSNFDVFETVDLCPVCGFGKSALEFPSTVRRCENCHVLYRSPRPSQSEITRSYDSGETYTPWAAQESERRAMWLRRIEVIRRYKKSGDLLDIGTGDGHFLRVAAEAGFQVTGTETSAKGAEISEGRGFTPRIGQIEDLDFGGQQFDVISMWHVLEHVPIPSVTFSKVHKLLKPSGIFIAAVPNEENCLFRHRIGVSKKENPLGEITWGSEIHLTHFQPKTLREGLRVNGFEPIALGVDDIYAVRSLRNRMVLGLHKVLTAVLGWNFGVAMYVVARRSNSSLTDSSQQL